VGDIVVGASYRRPLSQFAKDFAAKSFHDRWLDNSRRNVNSLGSNTPLEHSGISLPIPVRLPSKLTSILGPGGPALNVSGSESIRLSGTSNWTNSQIGVVGQRQSLFPSLDMQQDLDIRLEGQLSDRVKVNLLQNSANQVPLANRIAINYRGDEDDFVQALDLGNTNLSLPGTQYVSYSGKNEGLFGVKFASRIGALDFTGLASKAGGSERTRGLQRRRLGEQAAAVHRPRLGEGAVLLPLRPQSRDVLRHRRQQHQALLR
jgi:cell surface protein SprA